MLDSIKNYFANFDGVTNTCRTIALWLVIALVLAFVVNKLYVLVSGKKSDKHSEMEIAALNRKINRIWIIVALAAAVALIITFAVCYFLEVAKEEDVLQPILFYPLLVTAIAVVGSGIALFVKPDTLVKIITAAVCGAALAAALVCMIIYYASGDAGEALSNIGLYVSAAVIVAAVVTFAFLADRKSAPFDTKPITFAAICVALSFALSYVRIFRMPMGGSITFASMLPIMLFAFMFGSRKGILAGLILGILQAIQDPWIIHPAQFVLDYAVAFASIGLTGCIRDMGLLKGKMRAQFAVGAVIACAFRFISHYFAGVFAFGMYGEYYAGQFDMPAIANEYLYSLLYQAMYIIPELIVVLAAGMLVFASKNFRRQIELYSQKPEPVKTDVAPTAENNA